MTKKDYEAIARVFRNAKTFGSEGDGSLVYSSEILSDLIEVFETDNPRFDQVRFVAACKGMDAHDSAGRKVRYSS